MRIKMNSFDRDMLINPSMHVRRAYHNEFQIDWFDLATSSHIKPVCATYAPPLFSDNMPKRMISWNNHILKRYD